MFFRQVFRNGQIGLLSWITGDLSAYVRRGNAKHLNWAVTNVSVAGTANFVRDVLRRDLRFINSTKGQYAYL